uniref:C2H2-type domain-containing protein n=1 Tax=Compsopogon caeruleus TaxID=31354 RepID=A0A7S1XDG2_9RHOD
MPVGTDAAQAKPRLARFAFRIRNDRLCISCSWDGGLAYLSRKQGFHEPQTLHFVSLTAQGARVANRRSKLRCVVCELLESSCHCPPPPNTLPNEQARLSSWSEWVHQLTRRYNGDQDAHSRIYDVHIDDRQAPFVERNEFFFCEHPLVETYKSCFLQMLTPVEPLTRDYQLLWTPSFSLNPILDHAAVSSDTLSSEVYDEWNEHLQAPRSHLSMDFPQTLQPSPLPLPNLVCPTCGKAFRRSSRLNRHRKAAHSDFVRFTCPSCRKTFTERYNLSRHISSVHENKRSWKCFDCDATFSLKFNMVRHWKAMHAGQPNVTPS